MEQFQNSILNHDDVLLEEKLVDYLNFFEFIASLWKLGQLSIQEINLMFEYYIRLLGKFDFLMKYIHDEGFEGLADLVSKVREMNNSR